MILSICSALRFSFFIMKGIIAGSIFQHLDHMITPSNGVSPIDVSTTSPFLIAVILAQFQTWHVMIFRSFLHNISLIL
jgi:hypothetical protein